MLILSTVGWNYIGPKRRGSCVDSVINWVDLRGVKLQSCYVDSVDNWVDLRRTKSQRLLCCFCQQLGEITQDHTVEVVFILSTIGWTYVGPNCRGCVDSVN